MMPAGLSSSHAINSDSGTVADMSFTSRRSSAPTSVASVAAENLTPLLKGMPGREISAAKTDGAAFAMDLSAPDILIYPQDLSTTEFHVHPFARQLDLSTEEKARLGLIIPKERSSRNF
jgi:hypothetical protein